MNSENGARRFLGQFVYCAPKPCNVEVVLVQADYHEIGFVSRRNSTLVLTYYRDFTG